MTANQTIKERIYLFCRNQNISIKAFEQLCGMSNGYISSMRKGLGGQKLNNVLSAFPTLNRNWLLFGEGEMLRTEHNNITNSNVIEGSPGAKITSNEKDREIEYLRTMLAEKDARISELKQIIELLKK